MPQPGKSLWPIAFAIHPLEQCADLWVRGVHGKRLWVWRGSSVCWSLVGTLNNCRLRKNPSGSKYAIVMYFTT